MGGFLLRREGSIRTGSSLLLNTRIRGFGELQEGGGAIFGGELLERPGPEAGSLAL